MPQRFEAERTGCALLSARTGETLVAFGRGESAAQAELCWRPKPCTAPARSKLAAAVQLAGVLGLAKNPGGRRRIPAGARPTNDNDAVHPVLVKISGHATVTSQAAPDPAMPSADAYAQVLRLARGVRGGLCPGDAASAMFQSPCWGRSRRRTERVAWASSTRPYTRRREP